MFRDLDEEAALRGAALLANCYPDLQFGPPRILIISPRRCDFYERYMAAVESLDRKSAPAAEGGRE